MKAMTKWHSECPTGENVEALTLPGLEARLKTANGSIEDATIAYHDCLGNYVLSWCNNDPAGWIVGPSQS